jgi:hypothetical protein
MVTSERSVPTDVRTQMAHAHVQWIAEGLAVRLLHIKGAALDPRLRWPGRSGSDADILVPPTDAQALVSSMHESGWTVASGFRNGSPFEHAVTLRHSEFGWADVHRYFPGLGRPDDATFDQLWRDRAEMLIGGQPCAVPSLPAQALILLLHAARSPNSRADRDIDIAWGSASSERRAEVTQLVENFEAHVGFSAATGGLDGFQDRPDYALWKVASGGGTRIEEWRARTRAAPSRRAAVRLLLRAPLVNVQHLEMVLWRRPTRREIVTEFFARPARGMAEQWRASRKRRTDGRP